MFSTDICVGVEFELLRESVSFSSAMVVGAFSLSLAAILFLIRDDSDFLGGFSGRTWQRNCDFSVGKLLHCFHWKMPHLVYPHLLQCEGHALLHIHPAVRLLPEDFTGDQGCGGDHPVLLTTNILITVEQLWNQTYSYPLILDNLVDVGPLVWIGLQTS